MKFYDLPIEAASRDREMLVLAASIEGGLLYDGASVLAAYRCEQVRAVMRQLRAARGYLPWQRLYFLPDPHGQGSLRPTFSTSRRAGCGV